jgi:hypothetical protein
LFSNQCGETQHKNKKVLEIFLSPHQRFNGESCRQVTLTPTKVIITNKHTQKSSKSNVALSNFLVTLEDFVHWQSIFRESDNGLLVLRDEIQIEIIIFVL